MTFVEEFFKEALKHWCVAFEVTAVVWGVRRKQERITEVQS